MSEISQPRAVDRSPLVPTALADGTDRRGSRVAVLLVTAACLLLVGLVSIRSLVESERPSAPPIVEVELPLDVMLVEYWLTEDDVGEADSDTALADLFDADLLEETLVEEWGPEAVDIPGWMLVAVGAELPPADGLESP